MAPSQAVEYMLTTVDNPFDPFTQYDEWNAWDMKSGYNTNNLLARIARTSPDHSEADLDQAIREAIDEIVLFNVSGMHRKVSRKADSD